MEIYEQEETAGVNRINSSAYWEERFKTNDWEQNFGENQTYQFAKVAMRLIPEFVKVDICKKALSICDLGCAEGDAFPAIQEVFNTSKIYGLDISETAVSKATNKYPMGEYSIASLFAKEKRVFPVIFCSNVMEHFVDFDNTLRHVLEFSTKYTIIMVPFRETLEIDEHEIKIDTSDIPLKVGTHSLIYTASVKCEASFYNGEQLLLIFENDGDIGKLSNIVEHVENKIFKMYLANLDDQKCNIKCIIDNYEARYRELEQRYDSTLKGQLDMCNQKIAEVEKNYHREQLQLIEENKRTQEELYKIKNAGLLSKIQMLLNR